MVDFRKKTICPKDAFGAIFRRRREELGVSLGGAAKKTGVARHYLAALEEGRYGELPGFVYGKSFVRVYSALLKLSTAPLLRAFSDEYTMVRAVRGDAQLDKDKKKGSGYAIITPLRVRFGLAIFLAAILGVYLGGEVFRFVRPPRLVVESPVDQMVTTVSEVRVAGSVDTRATLFVNDTAVTHADGAFSALLPLDYGTNSLRIRAFRRSGKETVVVRNVIREDKISGNRLQIAAGP